MTVVVALVEPAPRLDRETKVVLRRAQSHQRAQVLRIKDFWGWGRGKEIGLNGLKFKMTMTLSSYCFHLN